MDTLKTPRTSVGARIARLGFRKWYERELLSGHAHMVLCFLSVVAMLASMEAIRGAPPTTKLLNAFFVLLTGAIGVWALRRYLFLLMRAEQIANQANCPDCGEYGRFGVVGAEEPGRQTHVCCRKCAHNWHIDTGN